MPKRTFLFIIVVTGLTVLFSPIDSKSQFIPKIELNAADGTVIPLEKDDLSGLRKRPLAETKARLDKKYYEGFFLLYRIKVKEGTRVKGKYTLVRGPLRLTIFEISKEFNSVRKIRVAATGFYQVGETVEFETDIRRLEENVFFITAESVESESQLNPALKYVNEVENEAIIKGYSSNLGLNIIKFNISGKDEMRRPVEITKDFDWLVSQLINPIRVISIDIKRMEIGHLAAILGIRAAVNFL
ncbi:MAG: hypothetical protein PVI11_01355 [Candidatus Aminicenantes bacterium]